MSFFTIDPTLDHVRLAGGASESIAFSVTNKSGVGRQLRALIEADRAEARSWFAVAPEIQDVRVDETVQFVVTITAPADAAAGTYPFRLKVVAEDDPDDVHSESQSIPVEVGPATTGSFPWWILIVAAVVLAVVALVLFLVLRGGDPDPTTTTTTTTAPTSTTTTTPTTTTTTAPTTTTTIAALPSFVLTDCLSYDPATLVIEDLGATGWRLNSATSAMVLYDSQADAERGLAVASNHTEHCFIGRNTTRPDRSRYVHDFWNGDSGLNVPIPQPEDCLAHNQAELFVENLGADGWRLRTDTQLMALFDNQDDAEKGLAIAEARGERCFIGRNNSRPDRLRYISEYWR